MSVKQMALVWEHDFGHAEQSVMLALADHAHDDGTEIRPSVGRLAWKTGYEGRQVQRILKHLRDDIGILVLVKEGGGRGKPNVYRFDWTKGVKKSPFQPKEKGDTTAQKGDISEIKGDKAKTPEPSSSNHPLEPSSSPRASTSADALSLQKKEWKKEAVAQLVERIDSECSTELAEAYKGRWARDVGRFLEKARTSEALDEHMAIVDEATDRAVARYDDYPLSFADAQRDCQKGRGGNAPPPTAIEQANGTPQEVIEYVFANTRNSVLRDGEERLRLAMSRFDFTSGEQPPFPVQVQIGGSEQERWNVLDSINALCRRALREAKGAA